jgi:hypothetical protein
MAIASVVDHGEQHSGCAVERHGKRGLRPDGRLQAQLSRWQATRSSAAAWFLLLWEVKAGIGHAS